LRNAGPLTRSSQTKERIERHSRLMIKRDACDSVRRIKRAKLMFVGVQTRNPEL